MSEPRQPLAQTVEEFIKITTSMSTERDLNRLLNMVVTSADPDTLGRWQDLHPG